MFSLRKGKGGGSKQSVYTYDFKLSLSLQEQAVRLKDLLAATHQGSELFSKLVLDLEVDFLSDHGEPQERREHR